MAYLYPDNSPFLKAGLKTYWGSLYGSADALAIVEHIQQKPQVVLLIANDIAHQDTLYESLNFYNDTLDILKFDNWEVLPYDQFSPHPDITSNRLATLSKLRQLNNGIVITTLETIFSYLCPIEFSEKYSFDLKIGDAIDPAALSEKLLKIGYNRVTTVMEHGEFNIRGSLIDLYPMGASKPYRLDLFDQDIETIRTFDTSTQRSESQVDAIALLPAREFSTDQASIDLFKQNYEQTFGGQGFIYREISEGRLPGGIEFYLPLFFNATNTLFDYLPNTITIATFVGFSTLVDQTYADIQSRFTHAQQDLERPPLAINRVFLSKDNLFSAIKKHPQLIISPSKLEDKPGHLNFSSKLLPPLRIDPQAKNPLAKLSSFVARFKEKILIVCESHGRQSILEELLKNHNLEAQNVKNWVHFTANDTLLNITNQPLSQGLLSRELAVITEDNLFGQEVVQQQRRRRAKHKDFDEAIKSLVEIKTGDPIVHENYGVGRYLGLKTQTYDAQSQDFLQLEYAGGAKLMVPMTSLNLISRYSGASPDSAPLHKLGTPQWSKAKQKAGEALHDVAAELLEIYAKRESQTGFSFPEPNDAYTSFVSSFAFEETPDQLKTMGEVLADMRSNNRWIAWFVATLDLAKRKLPCALHFWPLIVASKLLFWYPPHYWLTSTTNHLLIGL